MNQSSLAPAGGGNAPRAVALGNPEVDGLAGGRRLACRRRHAAGALPGALHRPPGVGRARPSGAHAGRARAAPDGEWIRLSYADVLQSARRIGQALLDRGLSAERPLVILSGNDLEHFQLALGAMYAGIPYAPLSPAYSLVATDPAKLRDLIEQLTPGALFACDGTHVRTRHRGRAAGGCGTDPGARRGAGPHRHQLRLAAGDAAVQHRRAQRGGRAGDDRQVPVHLGLDQEAEGGHHDPPDAVLEPADAAADLPLLRRRAAGAARLAALEPYLRGQPQRRHRAVQRRHALPRRRPPDAARVRHHA